MKNKLMQNKKRLSVASTTNISTLSRGAAILTTLAICAQPTFAQTKTSTPGMLEEVTVTAQRRTERSLDVPIAITAIGAEQLGKGDVQQLSDVMKFTPGLRFDNTAAFAQPTIRGVGTAVAVAGGSSNVGIYTDGFYSPSPLTADSELLNVESVQVLKGPQGTLFGRNSTGGAILVTTRDPSTEPAVELEASYGSYDTQRYQLYATAGLGDKVAFDVAGLLRESDGYIKNIYTGADDEGDYENSTGRLGVLFTPTDRLSVLLRYSYADVEDNSFLAANAFKANGEVYSTAAFGAFDGFFGPATVTTKSDEVANDYKSTFNGEVNTTQLTVKFDLGFALLTSYSQYREENSSHTQDFDVSSQPLFHYNFDNYDRVITQEFLLSSSNDSRLQWTTGLFYFSNVSVFENNEGASFGGPFIRSGGSGVDVTSLALFGDVTYSLLDNLYLTVGARYSQDEVNDAYFLNPDADPILAAQGVLIRTDVPDIDDNQVSPRVALRFEPNENSSMYISYTEGYKSAILNVGGGTLDGIVVDPEQINALEIGYKYSSGSVVFDTSAYYYDYQDLQVASYIGASSVIKNAADSHILGIEGQIRIAATEKFEWAIGANYMEAEYDNFEESQVWNQCLDLACGQSFSLYIPTFEDSSGYRMQHAPTFTANLGFNYTTEMAGGSFNLSGTLYHTSDFFFDSSEAYKQEGYDLLSMRAAWTDPSDHYTIAVYGDNLTDEQYRNQALPQFYGTMSTWGAPQTFGVSVAMRY